ncbi:hypothetical protein ABFX02_03G051400 [Erythranthe guttata]
MAHIISSNLSLVFILISFGILIKSANSCHWTKEYQVMIVNNIDGQPSDLTFRCQSKNDDLGSHTISPSANWNWTFCNNLLKRTLYFCHFYWGSKQQDFNVFTYKLGKEECGTGVCSWTAKSDGFYLSDGTSTPVKKYDWR